MDNLGGDPSEQRRQVRSDGRCGNDNGGTNQSGNQAVLNGGGAGVIVSETSKESIHDGISQFFLSRKRAQQLIAAGLGAI
jgi:hypothetical protein